MREEPGLLDPCRDDPEQLLVYLKSGEVVSAEYRGQITIETFELNRAALVELRLATYADTRAAIRQAADFLQAREYPQFSETISDLYRSDPPFAALRRQFANQWVQFRYRLVGRALWEGTDGRLDLCALVGSLRRITNEVRRRTAQAMRQARQLPKPTPRKIPIGQAVEEDTAVPIRRARRASRVTRVEIRNLRAIRHMSLEMPQKPGGWTMLIGENGTGKSSVLQAIALALGGSRLANTVKLSPEDLLSQGQSEGYVRAHFGNRERPQTLWFRRGEGWMVDDAPALDLQVLAYAPTRLFGASRGSARSQEGVAGRNLFEPANALPNPGPWLASLTPPDFDVVARALKRLLFLRPETELARGRAGLIQVVTKRRTLPLTALSDGYKAIAGLALDMMRVLGESWGNFESAEGTALVDELGVHLHPRWQMHITGALREAFPRVQFVATTHDPLCLRGVRNKEVALLRRDPDDEVFLVRDLPPVEGLAVDQLLTSEYFGLSSTIDPEVESQFEEYYALRASSEPLSLEEEERLEVLDQRLERYRVVGRTQAERLALEAARDYLAKDQLVTSEGEHRALKTATRKRMRQLWEEL